MTKKQGGIKGITYPIVADTSKVIADSFGVLAGEYGYNEEGHLTSSGPMTAYRGLFLIDKKGIVRHQLINDLPLGRNIDEAVRMVEALQHVEQYGEVCPADWNQSKKAIKATVESVGEYLAK